MLEPYTVLDFTDERGELGPMLLADLGADVIRVEPADGTAARRCQPLAPGSGQSLQFLAFNRNKRSIVVGSEEREVLQALIRRAHFLFESWPNGLLGAYGLDFEAVKAINPRIVHVCVSPFGRDGPHAEYAANDLSLAAMGGPVSLQGVSDRAPVRLSVPQVWRHAGAEAAVAAMAAHARRLKTDSALFVDVSAQCAMTWTMLNAMDAYAIQGADFERGDSTMNSGAARIDIRHEAADGHLIALPMSRTILGCLPWMIEDGIADRSLEEEIDWPAYDQNARDPNAPSFNVQDGTALCRRFFAKHTRAELYEFGLSRGISLAPINELSELLALEHLDTRDYWRPAAIATQTVRSPGPWSKPSSGPLQIRNGAPGIDEHGAAIRAELAAPAAESLGGPAPVSSSNPLPFAGLKVADFAWVGVGPITTKFLADHGATVIRVESELRPDVLRGGGPAKDGVAGLNRSQFFGDFNTSKQSITLDMNHPDAQDIARRLAAWSDVVVESFAPGAISRMGLGYDAVSEINPSVVMLSTCLMGQTGPAHRMAGYGYHTAAIAGFYAITGWPDLAPSGPWVAYTDTVAPRFASTILAAALDRRRRTGEGCYIDLAQLEASLHFLGPELLDLQVNGRSATRMGNRSPFCAPQGCYPCAGDDQWCAIGVDSNDQWRALCMAMDRPDWASDAALAEVAQRLERHDEIDAGISAWTQTRAPSDVMTILQNARVPSGVVQRSSDLLQDPQYGHHGFYRYMDHAEMGHIPYAGHQYRISDYDNGPRAPAPLIGEHSFMVLSEILKMSDEEIGAAYASGAVN